MQRKLPQTYNSNNITFTDSVSLDNGNNIDDCCTINHISCNGPNNKIITPPKKMKNYLKQKQSSNQL